MSLQEKIKEEILLAMKEKDAEKRDLLKVVKGEIERGGKHATDEFVLNVIKKTIEGIQETTPEGYERQIEILNSFLPVQLNNAEIVAIIGELMEKEGYSSKKDLGMIMRYFKDNYSGRYDGKVVNKILSNILK